jgi:CheY-like chemotaxis protein
MKILIVEDNQAMRRLIRGVVSEVTTEVLECEDGADALAMYVQHRPDWVLMDIRMPRLNGIEAVRQIVAADPQARIVIVTNYDDARMRESARVAGASDYVLKEDLSVLKQIVLPIA